MPLVKGSSQSAVSKNIDELTHHGSRPRSHDQIVAIALSEADKSRQHRAHGGGLQATPLPQQDAFHEKGLFPGDVAGRTDRLPHTVQADSFVLPADVVSAIGQNNTPSGAKLIDGMLAPYSHKASGAKRAAGGESPGTSSVIVASGEYLVNRDQLQNIGKKLRATGKSKARTDLAAGHEWARDFVDKTRKQQMKFLKTVPKPKK